MLPEVSQYSIHRDAAGDFPGGMAAHSVAYHENAEPLVIAETVLVGRSHQSHVGQSRHV